MSPLQIARAHCANYQGDGSCLGIMLGDDLQPQKLIKHPKCVLAMAGVRCEYFEQCVMPMGSANWPGLGTPHEHQEFAEGIKQYQRASNVSSQKRRTCKCGRELEHGKQLCYVCRNQRRAESKRLSRLSSAKKGTKVENQTVDNKELTNEENGEPYENT